MDENKKIELNEGNKLALDRVRKTIAEYSLNFTEESIDFVINKLNKSFEDTVNYSDENLKIILMCGLPSHSRPEALKIMKELREDGINYKTLHQILVYYLRKDGFFMDTEALTSFWNLTAYLLSK